MIKGTMACASCFNSTVCKYKEDFIKVCDAIDNLRIPISENVEMYCKDLECIQVIKPICKYFNVATKPGVFRSKKISLSNWEDEESKYSGFMGLG